jgi:hypothetical protein
MNIEITLVIALLLIVFYVLANPLVFSLRYDIGRKQASACLTFFPFDFRAVSGKKKRPVSRINFQLMRKLFRDELDTAKTVIVELIALCKRIGISTDTNYLNILLKGGLGPPDLTGEVYGAIEILRPMLGTSVTIVYQPDFTAESFEGTVVAGLKVRTVHIVKAVLLCVWKLPVVKLIKIIYTLRKGGEDGGQSERFSRINHR